MNAMREPKIWETFSDDYLANHHMRTGKTPAQEESRYTVYHLVSKLADGQALTVLDVGCGPGAVDTRALNKLPAVVCHGLDTPRMIACARENAGDLDPSLFIECDIERGLPAARQYDVVYFRHVLEHLAGFELILSQAFRLAKRRVIVTFFLPLGNDDHYHVLYGTRSFRNKYSKARFEEFLRVCGVWWDLCRLATNVVYDIRT